MKTIFICITILLCVGCSQYQTDQTIHKVQSSEDVKISRFDKSFYEAISVNHFITNDIGGYLEYDILTDYVIGLSSSQTIPFEEPFIQAYHGVYNGCETSRSSNLNLDKHSVRINDVILDSVHTRSPSTANLRVMYGQDVEFEITCKVPSRADDENIITTRLYVPQLISVTSPKITDMEDLYPLCDYRNFVLKWNKDEKNSNGILVIVEWLGTCCYGDSNPAAYIRRVDCVQDTGETVLKTELFEGIPDTAVCHLTILRGSVENVVFEDYSYKLLGEAHTSFPFILIRELTIQPE